MKTDLDRRQTPEEQELENKRARLVGLEVELAQRELDLETLKAELALFESHYLREVGVLYAELDEIEAKIAEVLARLNPANGQVREQARQARARAQESAGAVQKSDAQKKFSASESLKKLYRDVAKSIHPDLATDEVERARRQKLMAEADFAYEKGDEIRLQGILHEWESSPESVQGEGVGVELVRVIRKIA